MLNPVQPATQQVPVRKSSIKLAELKIQPFDGDVFKWREFWDLFKVNYHHNANLSNTEKYSYLRHYLTGRALQAVVGLEATDDSYPKAVKNLEDLYGSHNIAIQAHMSLQTTQSADYGGRRCSSQPSTSALAAGSRRASPPPAQNGIVPCMFCDATTHPSFKYSLKTKERKEAMRRGGRCFICTKRGHRAYECNENRKCIQCNGEHHVFICEATGATPPSTEQRQTSRSTSLTTTANDNGDIVLKTMTLTIFGPTKILEFRCLLDAGSHRSYISTNASKLLGLQPIGQEKLRISGFGGKSSTKSLQRVQIGLGEFNGSQPKIRITCLETERICEPIFPLTNRPWIEQMERKQLKLAEDPVLKASGEKNGNIDLLIGTEHYYRILTGFQSRLSATLMAVQSIFGWFVHGVINNNKASEPQSAVTLVLPAQPEETERPEDMLASLFEMDGLETSEEYSTTTDPAVKHFKSTVQKKEGRYFVNLPWKEEHQPLPTNEGPAKQQVKSLIQRLKKQPKILQGYHELITDHLARGFVEEVSREEQLNPSGVVHTIPHHAVIRMDKVSTKIRAVFNASFGSPSLNDSLHSGPNLVPPMLDVVIRFRQEKIALVADIEKAFLQIRLAEVDRNAVRFFWVEDPQASDLKYKLYRWKSVVFGVTSSPFQLAAVLNHH